MSNTIEMYDSSNPDVVTGDGAGMSMEQFFNTMTEEQQNVPVRDGDDSIEVVEADEEFEPEDEQEEGEVEYEDTPVEITPVQFDPAALAAAQEEMRESQEGYGQMVADIVSRGISKEEVSQMEANWDAQGNLTDQQWNRLAEIGYPKQMVLGQIRGQQVVSQNYINHFVASVGGIEKYNSAVEMLNPAMQNMLGKAIAENDLNTAQSIINLAGQTRAQRYGVPAQRSLATRAIQSAPTPVVNDGFQSKQEMVNAMNDKRYGRDSSYTKDVQRKVMLAPW